MGAPMTSKTGLATPQFGQQGLGQWGQAHPGGLQQLGQSIGGGYKPMPFNVNTGQSAVNTNPALGAAGNALNAAHGSVGTTPNTLFPPRPADMGMNVFPPTQPGPGISSQSLIRALRGM